MDRLLGIRQRVETTDVVKLQFTKQAINDLVRLCEFIAEKNPAAAVRFSDQLIERIDRVCDQPELGSRIESLSGVREWVARDYVVHHVVLNDTVIILQIWDGREDRVHDKWSPVQNPQ